MTGRLRTTRAGLELIKSFEGFREAAARLPDGRWTIGYGHVRSAREGVVISEQDAEDLLRYDLQLVEEGILSLVYSPLTQNQFDALASLVFNISPGQFKDSDILRRLNAGEYIAAANGFDAWRKARINGRLIVVDALVRRRAMEKAMFLEHPGGRPAAPTPLVTPEVDTGFLTQAVEVIAPLKSASASVTAKAPPTLPASVTTKPARPANDDVSVSAIMQAVGNLVARPAPEAMIEARTIPEDLPDFDAPPEPQTRPRPQLQPMTGPSATPTEASKVVAARIARILERASRPSVADAAPASAHAEPETTARTRDEIPEELPNFEPPPALQPGFIPNGAAPAPKGRRPRIFIDDTEVFDPGRDPAQLFAEGEAKERQANAFRRVGASVAGMLDPKLTRLAPWIVILVLAVLGLGIGLVDSFAAPAADGSARGAGVSATVLAVSGLMLVMSVYFIATRAGDPPLDIDAEV